MNNRGQGHSVFMLLISAVVAFAILVILLQVLGIINFNPTGNPVDGASSALKTAVGALGTTIYSEEVVFNPRESVSSHAISNKAKAFISEDQICLLLGSFGQSSDSKFSYIGGIEGKAITYTGISPIKVRYMVLCDKASILHDAAAKNEPPMVGDIYT
ncbi:MAG: hypothetical protein J7L14_00110, partial [Candidatus Diapherotrites archaeon]|nr:hypothetical protein [Candidatus Diapherotrites archaeon]